MNFYSTPKKGEKKGGVSAADSHANFAQLDRNAFDDARKEWIARNAETEKERSEPAAYISSPIRVSVCYF